jgi:hypothetical protein
MDAYPYPVEPKHIHDADTRGFIDYFVDSNVVAASDALLTVCRGDLLDQVNIEIKDDRVTIDPFVKYPGDEPIYLDSGGQVMCGVWHISLQRLLSSNFQKCAIQAGVPEGKIKESASVVNSIPTRYKLTVKDKNDKDISTHILQECLFTAVHYLVSYDRNKNGMSFLEVQEWLNK